MPNHATRPRSPHCASWGLISLALMVTKSLCSRRDRHRCTPRQEFWACSDIKITAGKLRFCRKWGKMLWSEYSETEVTRSATILVSTALITPPLQTSRVPTRPSIGSNLERCHSKLEHRSFACSYAFHEGCSNLVGRGLRPLGGTNGVPLWHAHHVAYRRSSPCRLRGPANRRGSQYVLDWRRAGGGFFYRRWLEDVTVVCAAACFALEAFSVDSGPES